MVEVLDRKDLSMSKRRELLHAEYQQVWNRVFFSDWIQRSVLGIRLP